MAEQPQSPTEVGNVSRPRLKRPLTQVEDVASEFSPHYKSAKIDAMAEFIKSRFTFASKTTVLKSSVVAIVKTDYDSSATNTVVGRAVLKAFGARAQSKSRAQRDVYINLKLTDIITPALSRPSISSLTSNIPVPSRRNTTAHSSIRSASIYLRARQCGSKIPMPTTVPTRPLPPAMSVQTQTRLTGPVKAKQDSSQQPSKYNVEMNLTSNECVLVGMMRQGDTGIIRYIKQKELHSSIDTAAISYIEAAIAAEVKHYASLKDTCLRNSSAAGIQTFTLQICWDEFQQHLPILTQIISAACIRKDQDNLTKKTLQAITPSICTAIAKCLSIYSRKLSAWRTLYSLFLNDGGITDTCMNLLAKLNDCTTHQSILPKVNELANQHHSMLAKWSAQKEQYAIVFDNVDIHIKPRQQSQNTSNTMHHMVQSMAVKERVQSSKTGGPSVNVMQIQPHHLLPTTADHSTLKTLMIDQLLKIWKEMPAMQTVITPSSEKHPYTHRMKMKSEMVNLGVHLKNENIKEDLLVCMQDFQNLVTESDDMELQHKLCVGDYLSFERGQQVISSQSDNINSADRLEGLIMCMADFHVQMNFLKLGFKLLFNTDSQPSAGSLSHAKDFLNAKNVTSNPAQRYYDCGSMFDKVFKSYIFTVAMEEFGFTALDDISKEVTEEQVKDLAKRTVEKFVDMSVPKLDETEKVRCSFCKRKYKNEKNLRKHHLKDHRNEPLAAGESDGVFNYSCILITIGLLRTIHNRAIQLGNGATIMLLYKFMTLLFKANGSYKYGCGLLETTMQTLVLPQHLSKRLIWNRFFNSHNSPHRNIPLDLQMEHENRRFKQRLKTYRGKFTQAHIDRISRGRSVIGVIVRKFSKSLGHHTPATKLVKKDAEDVKALTDLYYTSHLFTSSETTSRVHSPSLSSITPNALAAGLNSKSLDEWVDERIKLTQLRNYYRQFLHQDPPLDASSSLDPLGGYSDWSSFDNTIEID